MKLKPTNEQKEILDAVKHNKGDIRINAYAGTGKSTTLCMIAEKNPDKDFLYLAFNKAIAKEAEKNFPANCEVRTVHSLAWKQIVPTFKSQDKFFKKLQSFWKVRDYITHFKMNEFKNTVVPSAGHYEFCADIKNVVTRYKLSDQSAITEALLSRDQKKFDPTQRKVILDTAKKIWEAEIDMSNKTPLDHNTYLKLWELSDPQLNEYDFILFDEAQDANPAMNSVVSKLPMSRIYVGDQYQAIYGWNGAVNAMQKIKPDHDLFLSKSWRFGSAIANQANELLGFLGPLPRPIEGNDSVPSTIGSIDRSEPHTIIFRTNGALALEAINLLEKGKTVYVEGGVKELCNELRALYALKNNDFYPKMTRYKPFKTFGEVCEESKIDVTIRRDLMFIEKFGNKTDSTLEYLESGIITKITKKKPADAILTTAHKSKGLEWDQVYLYNDFKFAVPATLKFIPRSEREEFNLLYVAITRAKQILELSPSYRMFVDSLRELKRKEGA